MKINQLHVAYPVHRMEVVRTRFEEAKD